MKSLSIDIESFSPVNLGKAGVYKYADHPDFQILLFSYAIDDGQVCTVDLASGAQIPVEILAALDDPKVVKWAFNAAFERTCLSAFLGRRLDPAGWRCSMVWAATLGLPLSLKDVGAVLSLDVQKMGEGKDLIKYFCMPDKDGVQHQPSDKPEGWRLFKTYNARDVEVETAIRHKLAHFPVPDYVWEQYEVDQRINDRGIRIDTKMATNAIIIDEHHREQALGRAREITGLDNPAAPIQLHHWLTEKGCELESMAKSDVQTALENATGRVREALELRQELSKSSVAKYRTMIAATTKDGRAHDLLQF